MNLNTSNLTSTAVQRGVCPDCGTQLSEGRLASRCPHCLLELALEPGAAAWHGDGETKPPGTAAACTSPSLGQVGEYELVEEIAHGGMGAVYKAWHRRLHRWVALKRIRLEQWDHPESVLRFQMETEAIARLEHPNIVPLHEAGESGGLHYFTMKLVGGGSLAGKLADISRPLQDAAAGPPCNSRRRAGRHSRAALRRLITCLVKVVRAVHYAHQRGIIHRDLKPANVLIDETGEPMVSDFGLAKILGRGGEITQACAVLGSPNYMAPEQASGNHSTISTGVDIYSLGAILYEILTGEPPFKAATALETMRRVVEEHPSLPRSLEHQVDPDLETICLKCLEKDPRARYASASELAQDLQRWLDHLPPKARPVRQTEWIWRWCKRNPALACALAAVLALLVTVAAGSTVAAIRIQAAQQETRNLLTRMQLEKAEQLFETDETSQGLALLAHVVRQQPHNPDAPVRLASALSSANYGLPAVDPLLHEAKLIAMAPSPDGDSIISVTENGAIRRWDIHSGGLVRQTNTLGQKAVSAAFSPGGMRLVVATQDGTIQVWQTAPELSLLHSFRNEHTAAVKPVAVDAKGVLIGTVARFHSTARFWRADSGAEEFQLDEDSAITALKFSSNGQWAALGGGDGTVTVWDLERRQKMNWTLKHDCYVKDVEFSPDGRYLASGSNDQTARVWDLANGAKPALVIYHKHEITAVNFSDDSRWVATAGLDRVAQIWDIAAARRLVAPVTHREGLTGVHFLPGGEHLATTTYKSLCWLWGIRRAIAQPLALSLEGAARSVDASPDGRLLATGDSDGIAQVWDLHTGLAVGPPLQHGNMVDAVKFSPDGSQLVTASFDHTARVWHLPSGKVKVFQHENWVRTADFSPSGTRIVTASHDHTARIWDLETLAAIRLPHDNDVEDALFSNSGQYVGTASKDNAARIWDAQTGRLLARLNHISWVSSIRFSPGDRVVVTASLDKTACLWPLDTALKTLDPLPSAVLRHDGEIACATFSPNGQWVVTASFDGSAKVWDASTGQAQPYTLAHEQPVLAVQFSPDSRQVVTASRDGSARVWSIASGQPLTGPLRHGGTVVKAGFVLGGRAILTGSFDRTARIWPLPVLTNSDSLWLPDLAEFVSRLTFTEHEQFVPLSPDRQKQIQATLQCQDPVPGLVRAFLGGSEFNPNLGSGR